MDINSKNTNWTRFEKLAAGLSLLFLFLFALPLLSDKLFRSLFGEGSSAPQGRPLGAIAQVHHDIRHKEGGSFVWKDASESQNLFAGDSLFSGDRSGSKILLEEGVEVEMGPNSLMNFVRIQGVTMPELIRGQLKISVDKKVRIAVKGKIQEFTGHEATVRLSLETPHEEPHIQLLKGQASVREVPVSTEMEKASSAVSSSALPTSVAPAPEQEVVLTPLPSEEARQVDARSEEWFSAPRLSPSFSPIAIAQIESSPPSPLPPPLEKLLTPVTPRKIRSEISSAERQPAKESSESIAPLGPPPPAQVILQPTAFLDLETSVSTNFSRRQASSGDATPRDLNLAIRFLKWWGRIGLEGAFQKKSVTLQSSNEDTISPQSTEVRCHYDLQLDWAPFGADRSSRVSVYAGLENYQNVGHPYYFSAYQLAKLGSSMTFPLGRNWETGGELGYGTGTDSLQKMEISGFLGFRLSRQWGLKAGYRVNLLRDKQDQREGRVEGYSTLQYSF